MSKEKMINAFFDLSEMSLDNPDFDVIGEFSSFDDLKGVVKINNNEKINGKIMAYLHREKGKEYFDVIFI